MLDGIYWVLASESCHEGSVMFLIRSQLLSQGMIMSSSLQCCEMVGDRKGVHPIIALHQLSPKVLFQNK